MLDEAEFSLVTSKCVCGVHGESVLAEFERITAYKETNPAAIWHHRMALYGPPCKSCGKPLRTPQAKLCGSCMTPVVELEEAANAEVQKLRDLFSSQEREREAWKQAQMKTVQVPLPVRPIIGIRENEDNKELKEIGLGFLLLLLICMFLYWLGHSSGNPNCEMEGDGTISCQ
jgi:hypothetical protein